MKAIQFRTFGDPDVLEYVDTPTPSADAEDAVVEVKSASVNVSDVKNVAGKFEQTKPPRIPGRDFSGVVVSGPASWVGAEVWGTGGDVGFVRDGAHAQFIRIPKSALARKPSTLSHEQASAIGVTFIVASLGLERARLAVGERVAVLGAGGGVGGAVIQIAKALGCHVVGIDRHTALADSAASRLLDAYVPLDDFTIERVRALSGGVDVVFDTVGGVVFETALRLVRHGGRVIEISATGKRRVEFDLVDFYHNDTGLFGIDSAKLGVAASAHVLTQLAERFENRTLKPPEIAERFDLAHARQAYEAVAAGAPGRVVITM